MLNNSGYLADYKGNSPIYACHAEGTKSEERGWIAQVESCTSEWVSGWVCECTDACVCMCSLLCFWWEATRWRNIQGMPRSSAATDVRKYYGWTCWPTMWPCDKNTQYCQNSGLSKCIAMRACRGQAGTGGRVILKENDCTKTCSSPSTEKIQLSHLVASL